ncbi:unnamed protein product [Dimorphilus gyrociliatus]|uniref:Uncharacterized protein n=1 Tax=Dimorphilus gyrociliatus TaxID=2664684 RepID=A0A7I8VMA4_9ANNE|nr:unnamed protein product [Dimorphilus gyrociliatus]
MEFSKGHFGEAEKLYKQSLLLHKYLGRETDDLAFIEISLKLSMIYASTGRKPEAESGYEYCLNCLTKRRDSDDGLDEDGQALLGLTLDSYARYYMELSRYDKAVSFIKDSLKIARQVFGDSHEQVASLYNDLAAIECELRNFDEAKSNCLKAIEISENLIDKKYETTLYKLNLAEVLWQVGELPEALLYLKQVISTSKAYDYSDLFEKAVKLYKELNKKLKI